MRCNRSYREEKNMSTKLSLVERTYERTRFVIPVVPCDNRQSQRGKKASSLHRASGGYIKADRAKMHRR